MFGRLIASVLVVAAVAVPQAQAKTFLNQQQALTRAFPAGASVQRETVFLSKAQLASAKAASGVDFKDELIVRYVAKKQGAIVGYAYFDTHLVRTLPETVMFVVTPDAKISAVEILSFREPEDYFPKRRWLDQFLGRRMDNDLSLKRAIRPISGASLTGHAIVSSSRKMLSIHQAIESSRGPAVSGGR